MANNDNDSDEEQEELQERRNIRDMPYRRRHDGMNSLQRLEELETEDRRTSSHPYYVRRFVPSPRKLGNGATIHRYGRRSTPRPH